MNRCFMLLTGTLALMLAAGCNFDRTSLEAGFRDPPAEARPHTWWHWMNGNVTRAGITADLEAMKRIGLGGAQIFNVSEGIPEGPIDVMSPQWRQMVLFATQEAHRLGLELCMHNCAGWSSSGGPWITPDHAMQTVVTSEFNVEGPLAFSSLLPSPPARNDYYRDIAVLAYPMPKNPDARIKDIRFKSGVEFRYGQDPTLDVFPAGAIVPRDAIIDLTEKLDSAGRLAWDVPPGAWTILRLGHTPTGAVNAPAPRSGRGLECDKLSRSGLDAHWAGMMGPVGADLGPLMGSTLANCLIDSYEVGGQNWTADFAREFTQRRGYDLRRWLPVLSGRVVDSGEASERFLWDYRRTIADLFADNYYSYFAELCRRHGMKASIEPYDGPFECLLAGRDADIPMGEFWVGGGESASCKLAASVAHIYGRPIAAAEAFTASPAPGRWQNHPCTLKAVGDLMYCTGINRYIIHRYAHQPWPDIVPGMTMGQWGTHFERTNTWWDHGGPAWIRYLTRCQYLLQRGRFVADVCYFAGEDAPNGAPHVPAIKANGYDYDDCNAAVLLNDATVRDGRILLRDGMSYRALVLPDSKFMTPPLLAKIRDLVAAGATVIGPRPLRSPSLRGFPECDALVSVMADEVWGDCDGATVKEHAFGHGRVVCGRAIEDVLAELRVEPDCRISSASGPSKTAWIHRIDGDADIYFVSNQWPRAQQLDCSFRISGRAPELWHADTGVIEPAPLWHEADGRTIVSIPFDPAGSVFVVFRRPSAGVAHLVALEPPADTPGYAAPKIEILRARYEATDGAGGADVTAKVAELVARGETSIPANNAQFGDPTYMHVKQLRVEFTRDGAAHTLTAPENGEIDLAGGSDSAPMPGYFVSARGDRLELTALRPGTYHLEHKSGARSNISVQAPPPPIELVGPWTVEFPPNRGAPGSITLDKLISWPDHADAGVKYFSGTAEYRRSFDLAPEWLEPGRAVYLDLGKVACIAEVSVNGTDLGAWWKPPFAGDVTRVLRPGGNDLTIRVTNLWVNRLIGDEQYPDDCEWNGIMLKQWPQWLLDGAPRPSSQRVTFTTWKHWHRGATLFDSGLIGPVLLRPALRTTIGE